MLLPNLFVPGAAKSGTSALHEYLAQHPHIFMSNKKEPHFFSNDSNFGVDCRNRLAMYSALFKPGEHVPIRGESSTGYMVFPHVIERIQTIIPEPRFIFLLRNPIERLYSHYWWLRGRGFEQRPLLEAISADMHDEPNPANLVPGFSGYRYYFQFGCYAKWLTRYFESFGHHRVHIITTERLRADTLGTLNSCFEFLGLHKLESVQSAAVNETVLYRNPSLFHFVSTVGFHPRLRPLLKPMLPGKLQTATMKLRGMLLRKLHNKLLSSTKYPALHAEERNKLAALYAQKVSQLRTLTCLKFEEWSTDFPMAEAQCLH